MQVTGLFIYPIKACQGISLTQAEVMPQGLAGDRQLMLVDSQGTFITQRQYPQLAQVSVQLAGEQLTLGHPHQSPLTFTPTLVGIERQVQVWRDRLMAIDQGDEVAQWFKSVLDPQLTVRLVHQTPQHPRAIDPNYTNQQFKPVSFADGYPILVTATASLADLNQRLIAQYQDPRQAVPMDRFRPNVVIETPIPFMESDWSQLQINQVILALVKPCSRCLVTTTDQHTGDRHPLQEPLATLSRFRQVPQQGILFGENAIPLQTGILKLGDVVQILTGLSVNQ